MKYKLISGLVNQQGSVSIFLIQMKWKVYSLYQTNLWFLNKLVILSFFIIMQDYKCTWRLFLIQIKLFHHFRQILCIYCIAGISWWFFFVPFWWISLFVESIVQITVCVFQQYAKIKKSTYRHKNHLYSSVELLDWKETHTKK